MRQSDAKKLYDWYKHVSNHVTMQLDGSPLTIANNASRPLYQREAIEDNIKFFRKSMNGFQEDLINLAKDNLRDYKREVLSNLYELRDNAQLQEQGADGQLADTIENVDVEAETVTTSTHYNDMIEIDGEPTLIRSLPENYDFDGNQPHVTMIRELTYVDETGYREFYDDDQNVIDKVKIFADDEYDEDGNHLAWNIIRTIRTARQQQD